MIDAEEYMEHETKKDIFNFLNGKNLWTMIRKHFRLGTEKDYIPLGRLRITVERVDAPTRR